MAHGQRRFEDHVCVVTGAGSGIGRATALRLAAEGGAVACLDLDGDAAAATARSAGGRAVAHACDVADERLVGDVIGEVVDDLGGIDVLANVAGIGGPSRTEELALEAWNRIIGVNLTGTFLMCRASLPHLLERRGTIVNVSSIAGLQGHAYTAAYCATKGGVNLFTRSLAREYGSRGVRVNAVAPGGVDTPLAQSFRRPDDLQDAPPNGPSPLGRRAQPDEIAGAVAYLASDDAAFVTGTIMVLDGGSTA